MGGLIQADGGFYGVSLGGQFATGTIFRLILSEAGSAASIEKKAYSFTDDDYVDGRGAADRRAAASVERRTSVRSAQPWLLDLPCHIPQARSSA